MSDYTVFLDLAKEVQPPDKGILSRTLLNDDRLKAVAFGFAQGEELSEHTASMPAVLHFLRGEAALTLGFVTEAQFDRVVDPAKMVNPYVATT